jgi:hypothetical protein
MVVNSVIINVIVALIFSALIIYSIINSTFLLIVTIVLSLMVTGAFYYKYLQFKSKNNL